MTFGQQSGPPASAKQVQELLALLQDAGHTGFRDARGALGFTQRQGNGKFTRDEAEALLDSLQAPGPEAPVVPMVRAMDRVPARVAALRTIPDEQLADELRRRGWTVGRVAEP